MENFFLEENFFHDMDGLISHLDLDEETAAALPNDWSIDVDEAGPEKIFNFDLESIVEAIVDTTDRWDDRFPENPENTFEEIRKAIRSGFDLSKINNSLPSVYYPTGKTLEITKADIIDYLK